MARLAAETVKFERETDDGGCQDRVMIVVVVFKLRNTLPLCGLDNDQVLAKHVKIVMVCGDTVCLKMCSHSIHFGPGPPCICR